MGFAETMAKLRSLTVALAFVSLAAVAQTAGRNARTLRVVVDNNYAPYSFQSDDGKLHGIAIDQWMEWEKRTGVRVKIEATDWAQALRRMRAGEFDVIDCIVETPARREYFDFTPGYATVEASIFFRDDISGISDLASLRGFPVGVKAGDQHIDKLKESGVTALIPFQNNNEIVEAAKQHKIDVFVIDAPSALYLLSKLGIANDFRRTAPVFRDQLRRAVRKGDVERLSLVSGGFAAIDPLELKRIDQKWFGRTINWYEPYVVYAEYATAAAFLVIVALISWNYTLRRRILQRTAALAESEQRFRQIAENIHEVFWLVNADFRKTLYISPAYEAVWGRACESLYQDPGSFLDAVHPDDRGRVSEARERIGERGFEVEYRVVKPDGSVCWIWDRGFPIRNRASRIYRVAGIAEDITDRKLAADALKDADGRVRLIIDTIPAMAWSSDPDGTVDYLNQRWLDYAGLSLEQYVQDPMGPIHPEDVSRVIEKWLVSMAAAEPYEDEMRLQGADREYRWFLIRSVPLRDDEGHLVKWYGTSTDIEDYKRAEEKLKRSERQLAEAQRISHVGHWERNIDGGEIICSEETYRIFGLPPQDAMRNFEQLIHPEDRSLHAAAIARALRGEPFDVEYRVVRPDGEIRFVHSQGSAVEDPSGRPRRTFGAVQDITELKHAEEKLKTTSEQLRALSARLQSAREEEGIRIAREIHDDLGSTLTSLRWELEGIKKTLCEPGTVLPGGGLKEKLDGMLGLADTMITIVRRIASDLRPVVLDVLGLEEAVEWQAQQFQDRSGITVHCESPETGIELNPVQSTAVFRIFQEALTNVLRHARATRVDVTMVEDTGVFVLMIGDNGRGITEGERSGELSIGLLGMRERAYLIGGEIDVSGVEGEGTTVTLRLPLAAS
jgi:two-component system sensor histidine kinase/response regulator